MDIFHDVFFFYYVFVLRHYFYERESKLFISIQVMINNGKNTRI